MINILFEKLFIEIFYLLLGFCTYFCFLINILDIFYYFLQTSVDNPCSNLLTVDLIKSKELGCFFIFLGVLGFYCNLQLPLVIHCLFSNSFSTYPDQGSKKIMCILDFNYFRKLLLQIGQKNLQVMLLVGKKLMIPGKSPA